MRVLFFLVFVLSINGCATTYQSGAFSYTGGYYNRSINNNLEKIYFSGNSHVDSDTVKEYALFRSAEYAHENKKPYFIMYNSLFNAAAQKPAQSPSVGTIGGKPRAFCYVLLLDEYRFGAVSTATILLQIASMEVI